MLLFWLTIVLLPNALLLLLPLNSRKIWAVVGGAVLHLGLAYHFGVHGEELCGPGVLSIHCEITFLVPLVWIVSLTVFLVAASATIAKWLELR